MSHECSALLAQLDRWSEEVGSATRNVPAGSPVWRRRVGGFKQQGSHLQLGRTYISHNRPANVQEGPVCERAPIKPKQK